MAYIGGLGYFIGPIIGAVLLTLMNSLLSNYSDLWLLYLGVLFLLTVMFLPKGFAGLIMMHQVAWLRGTLRRLALPYLITGIPAFIFILSSVAMIELSHTDGEVFHYLGVSLERGSSMDWILVGGIAIAAFLATRKSLQQLKDAWEDANTLPGDEES